MLMFLVAARDPITGMPDYFGGTEFKDVTNMHPLAISAVLILGIMMILVPRRWAVLPMLVIACFISSVQKVVIAGLDFDLLRIMVVLGIFRIILRHEFRDFIWKPLDKAIVLWVISSIAIYTIQQSTFSAFINRLGFGFDAFGMYFLFRCLIKDPKDIDRVILSCILISIPVAFFFIIENRTGRNMFSVFGGVPELTVIREGRLRCQGAFSHPILAGCFWASLIPLFALFWWKSHTDKVWALAGIFAALIVIICCASSTPILGVLCGILGGLMFYARRYMRYIRWGILISLIGLHIVMKAPVWHLIARVSTVGGSTSWHRYNLINQAITHFGDWCLLGTKSTLSWDVFDITNQYVLEGIRGGFITLALFISILVVSFGAVGRLWRQSDTSYRIALSWLLGVSLFVHSMVFIGVSYFGQINIIWYLLLATIGSLAPMIKKNQFVHTVNQGRYHTYV